MANRNCTSSGDCRKRTALRERQEEPYTGRNVELDRGYTFVDLVFNSITVQVTPEIQASYKQGFKEMSEQRAVLERMDRNGNHIGDYLDSSMIKRLPGRVISISYRQKGTLGGDFEVLTPQEYFDLGKPEELTVKLVRTLTKKS